MRQITEINHHRVRKVFHPPYDKKDDIKHVPNKITTAYLPKGEWEKFIVEMKAQAKKPSKVF